MQRRRPAKLVFTLLVALPLLWSLGCDDGFRPATSLGSNTCMSRAVFGDPSKSPYTLPYQVGETNGVSQAYCSNSSHIRQLAYDFDMPKGAEIVAARRGTVIAVKEDSLDGSAYGTHNYVNIQHPDGTVAFYAHFEHQGVDVEVGETVQRGQRIGSCGDTGSRGHFHLHFGVYQGPPGSGPVVDIAVNFSNTDGPLDELGGLVPGAYYEALPY